MIALQQWGEFTTSPEWVVAIGTVAALGLSAYSIDCRRRDAIARRRAAGKQVGAAAYALKHFLANWNTSLNQAQGESPHIRAAVFRSIFDELDKTDGLFSDLLATASRAPPEVTERAAEASVLYYKAVRDIRSAVQHPELQKSVDHGQTPIGMKDGSIDHLTLLLRESRRALSMLTPEEIHNARELYWPTPNEESTERGSPS